MLRAAGPCVSRRSCQALPAHHTLPGPVCKVEFPALCMFRGKETSWCCSWAVWDTWANVACLSAGVSRVSEKQMFSVLQVLLWLSVAEKATRSPETRVRCECVGCNDVLEAESVQSDPYMQNLKTVTYPVRCATNMDWLYRDLPLRVSLCLP